MLKDLKRFSEIKENGWHQFLRVDERDGFFDFFFQEVLKCSNYKSLFILTNVHMNSFRFMYIFHFSSSFQGRLL